MHCGLPKWSRTPVPIERDSKRPRLTHERGRGAHAFALGPPLVFGVHVGPGASLAEWRLRSQDDIERLFELLLEVRERPARGPRARRAPGELVGGEK
jgi:hypothetical protein